MYSFGAWGREKRRVVSRRSASYEQRRETRSEERPGRVKLESLGQIMPALLQKQTKTKNQLQSGLSGLIKGTM